MKNHLKISAVVLLSIILFLNCDKNKPMELLYKGKNYQIPASTLILNLADSINGISTANQSSTLIYKTFTKAVFADYITDDMFGEQDSIHTIFKKVWFKGNTGYAELNPNLQFHNGRKVVAQDVEFSITRFFVDDKPYSLYTNANGYIALVLSNLLGYKKTIQIPHKKWRPRILEGIDIINEHTIAFHMQHKDLEFFNKLNMGYFPLVAQENLVADLKTFDGLPIGTGQYKVVTYDTQNHFYLLEKTPQGNKSAPKTVAFVFTDEDLGDIKFLYNDSQKDSVHVARNFNNALGFVFNFKSKLGADPRFRAVFDLALDRSKFEELDTLKRIEPDCQLIANYGTGFEYRINYKPADTQKATELTQELKEEYKEDFPKILTIPIRYLAERDSIQKIILKNIKNQLQNVGLAVEFSFDKNLLNLFTTGNRQQRECYPIAFFAKVLVREDPMANFNFFIQKNNNFPLNGNFSNSDYHDNIFIEKYEHALKDPKYIKDFNEYFISKNIFVVVAHQRKHFYYNKRKISSLGDQSEGVFINISNIET